jgi:hypothetical protein
MLLNILVFTFTGCFVAIVALGHVLLLEAIWPGLFHRRDAPPPEASAVEAHRLHQPN